MTFTLDEQLDLEATPRRVESFRYDLLDASNTLKGTLAVSRDQPPTVRNDVTAPIPRTLDGLVIVPRTLLTADDARYFADDIDPLSDRVRLVHVLGDPNDGNENAWGIFLFAEDDNLERSAGTMRTCRLVDQTELTAQLLSASVTYPAGTNVQTALIAEAAACGLISTNYEATTATLVAPVTGVAGQDTHDSIFQQLAASNGALRPYFDNAGVHVCRSAPVLASATAEHIYGPGDGTTGRVLDGTVHRSSGLLRAPNRYIARDTNVSTGIETVGIFDVPDSAPHSFANTGVRRVKSVNVQGLVSVDAANAAAAALYAQDASVFASLSFATPIDSRHDTFGIVAFDGENHIEHEWSAYLHAGGAMIHDVRRIYA